MRFWDEISQRLSGLSGATPEEARQALNEFDTRDIQAVRVSEGAGDGGGLPDPITAPVSIEPTDGGDAEQIVLRLKPNGNNSWGLVLDPSGNLGNEMISLPEHGDPANDTVLFRVNGSGQVVCRTLISQRSDGTNLFASSGFQVKVFQANGTNTVFHATEDNEIGFYGTTAIAKQTGVAVDAASIHAALVNLGLISS